MNRKDKILKIPWQRIDRGTRTQLKEVHFDTEDWKYVETAAATEARRLVSHDPDYSRPVRRILNRRLGLQVLNGNDGTEFVRSEAV
jgi:hypothetical protein